MQEHEISILAHLGRGDWLVLINALLVLVGALGAIAFGAWAREVKRATLVLEKLSNHFERMDKRLLAMEIWVGQKDGDFHRFRSQFIMAED